MAIKHKIERNKENKISIRNKIEENKEKIIKEILLLKEQINLNSFTPIHKRLDSGSEITISNLNSGDIRRTRLFIKIKDENKKVLKFSIDMEDNLMGKSKYIFRTFPEKGSYLNIESFDYKFTIKVVYDYNIYREEYMIESIKNNIIPFIELTQRNKDEIEEYRRVKNQNNKERKEND